MIKLYEPEIALAVRAKDVYIAEQILKEAKDKYISIMKKEANIDVSNVIIMLNKKESDMISPERPGGVILYAKQGKIVCDNTLDTRLGQVYYDLKPEIRKMLFP